jgi:FdhD protein
MKRIRMLRWEKGDLKTFTDVVAPESLLHVNLADGVSFDTIVTPDSVREFVYGNLFSEGIIKRKEDIISYRERKKGSIIYADVKLGDTCRLDVLLKRNYNIVWTECGSGAEIPKRLGDQFERVRFPFRIDPSKLPGIIAKTKDKTSLYRMTGAYHYAFLFSKRLGLVAYSCDIGRHNAVDKVIGAELLNDRTLSDRLIFITGRISSDIVLKCLRAKIPVLVSRSAPLLGAVELARKYNLGLVGFLRGGRYNVYSGEDFIKRVDL